MSMSIEKINNVSELVEKIKLISETDQEPSIYIKWVKKCDTTIKELQQMLREIIGSGSRRHIESEISKVLTYQQIIRNKLIIGGTYNINNISTNVSWNILESAFRTRIQTGVISNLKHKDPKHFLEDSKILFRLNVEKILQQHRVVKINATFCGQFVATKMDKVIIEVKYINTRTHQLDTNDNIEEWFQKNILQSILVQLEEFQERDSGWALQSIINLVLNINKHTLLSAASSYIRLPKAISDKKACINIQNQDDACFAWAVVSALYPNVENSRSTSSYPNYAEILNLNNIIFPMTIKQIPQFELQNNEIAINVFTLKKSRKNIYRTVSAYQSKAESASRYINLLVFKDDYENEYSSEEESDDDDYELPANRYHYCWIKNLSRLVSSQLSKNRSKKHICNRCLHYFSTSERLEMHQIDCIKMNSCRINLPNQSNKIVSFKNFNYKTKSPFVIYADLECVLKPSNDISKFQEHVPCSVGFFVKCSYDNTLSFFKSYRGEDCIVWFVNQLKEYAENLETVFLCPLPMDTLTNQQKYDYEVATVCHICENIFTNDDDDENIKVRDHCHLTGLYRGAAHSKCNINFKDTHIVPIIFHNLSGYDSHFILKNIAQDIPGALDILPINKEKYISFTKTILGNLIKYRFIDSYKFMAQSLDGLVSNLDNFPELISQFNNLENCKLHLITRKGIYPYDYIDSFNKFSETALPNKDMFYNKLNSSDIKDEDYLHAQQVWNEFSIRDLGEYSDLYLKTDVLLLADVFEQFRIQCIKEYELDPAHYFTLPGYTWDAMLKYTKINLELLTDIDMVLFVERGIRGGLSQCSKRYSKANNKYLPNYDSNIPNNYIMYFDINNQYGWAMSQYMPYRDFCWAKCSGFDVQAISDTSSIGYILEVDLKYPTQLHDSHLDLPFCPDHITPPNSKLPKLLATQNNKSRYVIHYQSLKHALSNGLELVKIYRILQFKQAPWLKKYIDLNTQLRARAKNDFEKDLFKMINNAVFGKTMENVRKYSIIKLKTKWEGRYGAKSLIASPNFKNSTIFSDNFVAIEMNKAEIMFNKPIYVGMAILDISKIKIYDFHYKYMKPIFMENCTALYTDTDSLIYEVSCEDIYQTLKADCHKHFDTSDYSPSNIWNIPLVNKKVLGLMKDELCGKIISEFVGLRSKMYAIRVEGQDKIKKSKGVKRHIVAKEITFADYLDCLNIKENKIITQNLIRSKSHNVCSIKQTKIALSPYDDKRSLIVNSHNTLPWGHYSLGNSN